MVSWSGTRQAALLPGYFTVSLPKLFFVLNYVSSKAAVLLFILSILFACASAVDESAVASCKSEYEQYNKSLHQQLGDIRQRITQIKADTVSKKQKGQSELDKVDGIDRKIKIYEDQFSKDLKILEETIQYYKDGKISLDDVAKRREEVVLSLKNYESGFDQIKFYLEKIADSESLK